MRRFLAYLLLVLAVTGCRSGGGIVATAPAAATPTLLEVAQTAEPATLDSLGRIHYGATRPVAPANGAFPALPAPAVLVRVQTVYPSDLLVALDGRELRTPRTPEDQEALLARGDGYFLGVITNIPPFEPGKPALREVVVVPPAARRESPLRLELTAVSINPSHTGAERISAPLVVPIVRAE